MINFSDILDRNCPLWTIEMGFQTIKISKFFWVAFPHNPLMAHAFSCLRDSSVIEKCPDYTYSKGWTVFVSTRIILWVGDLFKWFTTHTDQTWIFHPTCEILEIFVDAFFFYVFFKQCILTRIIGVNSQWENPDWANFKSYSFLVHRKYS